MLRQLRYRQDEQASEGDAPVPPDLEPARGDPGARGAARLAAARGRDLPPAGRGGRRARSAKRASWPRPPSLSPDQQLDAFDRAEESRLLRRVGGLARDRYAFSHALVRDAIYGELLRGRRVRYHHKIAVATERVHGDSLDAYVNELAHHFYMGAALADADKAMRYCIAAGERALRLLAFEEAVGHFTRGLEVAEQFGAAGPVGPLRRADRAGRGAEPGGRRARRPTPTSRGRRRWPAAWAIPSGWPPPRCAPAR